MGTLAEKQNDVLDSQTISRITDEERELARVYSSLLSQSKGGGARLALEKERARGLTADIVAARRAEDKAMLASDEAVSHALHDRKKSELEGLKELLKSPYFARIKLEEEIGETGKTRTIEYKLGAAANPDCRIIDWRKAPISKLYYEYREGDRYDEEIQGQDRSGKVALRHAVETERDQLKRLTCALGDFSKVDGEWHMQAPGEKARDAGGLQTILALITPEQFRAITEEAQSPVLIQGVAGSGKTSVALHRMAWLLHAENSDLKASECIVIVMHNALKSYVSTTLPQLDVHGVRVLTWLEWVQELVKLEAKVRGAEPPTLSPDPAPSGIDRLKRSPAMLKALQELAQSPGVNATNVLVELFRSADAILRHDTTKLLDATLIRSAFDRAQLNQSRGSIDGSDLGILVRYFELKHGGVPLASDPTGNTIGRYRHLVVDEVQEMSPLELSAVIGAGESARGFTFVGDTSQELADFAAFPGWEALRELVGGDESRFVELSVSHRSTLEIMRLADYVLGTPRTNEGRPGKPPLYYRCSSEAHATQTLIEWLSRVRAKFPNTLSAVICGTPQEARTMYTLLTPTFGGALRLGDKGGFNFEAGIVVTDAATSKGLEFHSVAVWNPNRDTYPTLQRGRNLLYTAITRAQEYLCIVAWRNVTELLPGLSSPLVRGKGA